MRPEDDFAGIKRSLLQLKWMAVVAAVLTAVALVILVAVVAT